MGLPATSSPLPLSLLSIHTQGPPWPSETFPRVFSEAVREVVITLTQERGHVDPGSDVVMRMEVPISSGFLHSCRGEILDALSLPRLPVGEESGTGCRCDVGRGRRWSGGASPTVGLHAVAGESRGSPLT
uniref:Uncharacterized protein n=1 Tax=Molossus molossus TaxID=27622 RepID=A0A7J8HH65_MOLMO|nr:hypothetical protein HJG59_011011 [Molossus molossus]